MEGAQRMCWRGRMAHWHNDQVSEQYAFAMVSGMGSGLIPGRAGTRFQHQALRFT
jgi:hypothetical protein